MSSIFEIIYNDVYNIDSTRNIQNLCRRLGKTGEEYGELWQAYLQITNGRNRKRKTWHDVREESIDLLIMSLDILSTPLPIDEGRTREDIEQEILEVFYEKMNKWKNQISEIDLDE